MRPILDNYVNWRTSESCWTVGCAYLGDRRFSGNDLHNYILGLESVSELLAFLKEAGGFFSVIRNCADGSSIAAVDKGRGFPLFFAKIDDEALVSDNARRLANLLPAASPGKFQLAEFRQLAHVSGNDTLHPGISQLRAGEALVSQATGGTPRIDRYFIYRQSAADDMERNEQLKRGEQAVLACASRLVKHAAGRAIAIPLSGGLDSTMLVSALKIADAPGLLTFTYGRQGASEVQHSQELSRELGVPWFHLEYNQQLWRKWFNSTERQAYYQMADNLCTLPHIQDFPAIAEIRQRGLIPDDTVIASGMSVESFYSSPSQPPHPALSDTLHLDLSTLKRVILDTKYRLWYREFDDPQRANALMDRIGQAIGSPELHGNTASCYESWFTHEKMSKFYNNSVRCYEFWGYDWWLPFWDSPAIEFWRQVPPPWRTVRQFTLELTQRLYQAATGESYVHLRHESTALKMARYLRHMIRGLPLLRGMYSRLRHTYIYSSDNMGWYGLFGQDVVDRLYHPKLSINSLLVSEYLGELTALPDNLA